MFNSIRILGVRQSLWNVIFVCLGISFSFGTLAHAEPSMINLGEPASEDGPTIAHIYEVGHYMFDSTIDCWYAWSSATGNRLRFAMRSTTSTGDIDGDGFDDIVIAGFHHWNAPDTIAIPPPGYSRLDSMAPRAAWIVFGNDRFGETDQYLHAGLGTAPHTVISYSGDYLVPEQFLITPFYLFNFRELACADMNRDGYDDVVIMGVGTRPSPDASRPTGCTFVSNIIIVYGSPNLRHRAIDMNNPSDLAQMTIIEFPLEQPSGLSAEESWLSDDWAPDPGSMSVADFDADGFPDIAIGVASRHYPADPPRQTENTRGAVTILFGGSFPVGQVVQLDDTQFAARQSQIWGPQEISRFGVFTTAADINGDGFDDLAIVHRWVDGPLEGDYRFQSAVSIIYGGTSLRGLDGVCDTLPLATPLTQITGIRDEVSIVAAAIRVGDIAAGDTNYDGYKDVAIGVANVDQSNANSIDPGATFTVFGSPLLPGMSLSLSDTPGSHGEIRMVGTSGFFPNPEYPADSRETVECYDVAGASLAIADVTGDGEDDWLIWGQNDLRVTQNYAGRFSIGRCYVVNGGANPNIVTGQTIDLASASNVRVDGALYPGCSSLFQAFHTARWYAYPFAGGDLNRDGFAEFGNCSAMGRPPERYALDQDDIWGSFEIVMGNSSSSTAPTAASATERFKVGMAPMKGFGGRTSPVLRTYLSFADGDGPSPVTVTLTRNHDGVSGFGDVRPANVIWRLETTRTAWTSAEVRFQYTDHEVAALTESVLKLYQSPALTGPWAEVAVQTQDRNRNEIAATVSELGYFVIVDPRDLTPPLVSLTCNAAPTVNSPVLVQVTLSEPVTGMQLSDVSATNATVSGLSGSGTQYQFTMTPTNQGTFSARIARGSVSDAAGNANAASNTLSWVYDSAPPSASLSSYAPPEVQGEITVVAVLSEPSTAFDASDIAATNATVSGFTGFGVVYTFTLTPATKGPFSAHVVSGAYSDAAGNANSPSNVLERVLDATGPTLTLSSTAPSHVDGEIIVSVAVSEPTDNFTIGDISLENAVAVMFSGSRMSYSFHLVPKEPGPFSAWVEADRCVDALFNGNTASNKFERVFERPMLRLLYPNEGGRIEQGASLQVRWESAGDIGDKIRIELWRKGKFVKTLKAKTKNDGEETVQIPAKIATKKGYTIRISSVTNHGFVDWSDKPFRVRAAR